MRIKMLTFLFFTSSLTSIGQNILDLTKAPIIINGKDTIKANKDGDVFCFQANDGKPLNVEKVVFAKNNNEAQDTKVFIGSKSFKKWKDVKNDIGADFQIKQNSTVSIIWGDHIWNLKMTNKKLAEKTTATVKGNGVPMKEAHRKSNNALSWLIDVGCLVVGLIIGFFSVGIIRRVRKLRANGRKNKIPTDVNGNDGTENDNSTEVNDNGKSNDGHKNKDSIDEQPNVYIMEGEKRVMESEDNSYSQREIALDGVIAEIINGYEEDFFKGCTDRGSKVDQLRKILSAYLNLSNDKKQLAKALGENENVETEILLNEIKKIKSELAKNNEQEVVSPNTQETIAVSELEQLINKNEKIKDVYGSLSKVSIFDSFRQLFEKLNRKLENSIDTKSSDDRIKAKAYVIEQLKLNGFNEIFSQLGLKKVEEYFVANTTLESGLSKIKEAIEKRNLENSGSGIQITRDASNRSDFNDFVKELKNLLPNLPDGIDSVENLAKVIKDLLENKTVENIADNNNTATSDNAEKLVIEKFLAEVGISSASNKDDAIDQIKKAFNKINDLDSICKQYGANNIKELRSAIKEQIDKSVKSSLNSNEAVKAIITNCRTTESITKSLSEAYISIDSEKKKIEKERNNLTDKLKEAYKKEFNDNELDIDAGNPEVIFATYQKAVCEKIEKEKKTISSLQGEISEKQSTIDANNEKFNSMLNEMKKKLENDLDEMQKSIQSTFIRPCDPNLKSQCTQNQSLLRDVLQKFSKQLENAKQTDNYEKFYKDIQNILEKDIVDEHGLTNVLTRYYAYSCLPFMTDHSREYGMRINHELMMRAFNAHCHFISQYGLQLIVPNLFADRIDDGEYQDCTGEKYGDLENLCPGVANYVLGISNSDKQHYITDLVQVGYKKDEEIKVKAKVIIAG